MTSTIESKIRDEIEALASTPPDNARIATVLFDRAQLRRWLHVHEARLPDSIAAAGPYDF